MKSTHYTYEGGTELYILVINQTYRRNQVYLVVFSTIARSCLSTKNLLVYNTLHQPTIVIWFKSLTLIDTQLKVTFPTIFLGGSLTSSHLKKKGQQQNFSGNPCVFVFIFQVKKSTDYTLVGGFNPFEKYESNWIISSI